MKQNTPTYLGQGNDAFSAPTLCSQNMSSNGLPVNQAPKRNAIQTYRTTIPAPCSISHHSIGEANFYIISTQLITVLSKKPHLKLELKTWGKPFLMVQLFPIPWHIHYTVLFLNMSFIPSLCKVFSPSGQVVLKLDSGLLHTIVPI